MKLLSISAANSRSFFVTRLVALATIILALAACASAQLSGGPASEPPPGHGTFGSGPQRIGVLAFAEPGNLSDGATDSVFRAAKLAAETLKGNPLTVVVRTVDPGGANLTLALGDLQAAGVKLVIGGDDPRIAAEAAKTMAAQRVPTLGLSSFADLGMLLYAAAFVPGEEAVALVNEAARRGYASIAVVSGSSPASQELTKSVLTLAAAAGISARPVDGATESQFVAGMSAMATAGVTVEAVVYAVGPERAGAMTAALKQDARFKSVAVMGNSGWALVQKTPPALKGAWYTAPEGVQLGEFIEKFRAANGTSGTLNAAMVYDLLVLAAALPQAVKEDPYAAEVLTNAQGFSGFTGLFRFGPTGMAAARNYGIVTMK
jgi:ABC-type branched-subunit amino acid transport system substrate-binding protein